MKLKPHCELLHAEGEDLMEVMSLDRGAGVRPVQKEAQAAVVQRCQKTLRRVHP